MNVITRIDSFSREYIHYIVYKFSKTILISPNTALKTGAPMQRRYSQFPENKNNKEKALTGFSLEFIIFVKIGAGEGI